MARSIRWPRFDFQLPLTFEMNVVYQMSCTPSMDHERETLIFSALEMMLQTSWIQFHITRCELEVFPNGWTRFLSCFDSWLTTANIQLDSSLTFP